eukprot:6524135-Prymnesium_polylepis.1
MSVIPANEPTNALVLLPVYVGRSGYVAMVEIELCRSGRRCAASSPPSTSSPMKSASTSSVLVLGRSPCRSCGCKITWNHPALAEDGDAAYRFMVVEKFPLEAHLLSQSPAVRYSLPMESDLRAPALPSFPPGNGQSASSTQASMGKRSLMTRPPTPIPGSDVPVKYTIVHTLPAALGGRLYSRRLTTRTRCPVLPGTVLPISGIFASIPSFPSTRKAWMYQSETEPTDEKCRTSSVPLACVVTYESLRAPAFSLVGSPVATRTGFTTSSTSDVPSASTIRTARLPLECHSARRL